MQNRDCLTGRPLVLKSRAESKVLQRAKEVLPIAIMTSITIKLPEDLKDKLKAQSRLSGKSCSALVRRSLEKELFVSKKGRGRKQSVLEKLSDLARQRGQRNR
jgi:hypothetical protein